MTTLSSMAFRESGTKLQVSDGRRCVMQVTWSLVAGGAETYALTVASGLDPEKYRALMCGVDRGGALEGEIARRGVPFHIMHRRAGIDLKLMWRMFRLFRRERVAVIHTHHFNQLFYSLLAAKLLGIRIIHTEHSVEAYKRLRLRWALKAMSCLCRKITVIGQDGYRTLRDQVGIPASRLEVIRAAVDLTRFTHGCADRAAARSSLDLRPSDRVAVIVARLYPEKNHALLLAAFRKVLDAQPDARLLIVGDGIEESAICAQVAALKLEQQVRLLGVRRDVPLILAASDVFVLCSDREGLPIAVLEAMAAAKPVIATSVGDLPLVVHNTETGLLVPRRGEAELAAAMGNLLANRALAAQMGAAGRKLVEGQYSLQQMVDRHQALYGQSAEAEARVL